MTRLACSCGKEYAIKDRAPGSRVRCRACQAVLVVPAPRRSEAVRSASERLERARGEPCANHPGATAARRCGVCRQWICEACEAAAPASHLCGPCARRVGTTEKLDVSVGVVATTVLAARTLARAFPRLLVLTVSLNAAFIVAAIAIAGVVYVLIGAASPGLADEPRYRLMRNIIALPLLLLLTVKSLVLLPAADLHVLDATLRGKQRGFVEDLSRALKRAWERKWALLSTYGVLLVAAVPPLVVFFPFFLGYFLIESVRALLLGLLVAIPSLGASLGVFGLALPAAVLEHRSGSSAIVRAWELARARLVVPCVLGAALACAWLVGEDVLARIDVRFVTGLGVLAFDLAWPALLVALYHGLAARESARH